MLGPMSNGYPIVSNQFAPHPNTAARAKKHATAIYRRPFSISQITAFEKAENWLLKCKKQIIIDSGCGTGDSTLWLSQAFPQCVILGIDQSPVRLNKAKAKLQESKFPNVLFIRARLEDFWRLMLEAQWPIIRHYIFYPNPWPKAEHHSRRWHGHSVFPDLISLSPYLEIRSNWQLYLEELSIAVFALTGINAYPQAIAQPEGISAFEKKYRDCQSKCYILQYSNLSENCFKRTGDLSRFHNGN